MFLSSLLLAGTLAATTERVYSEGYGVLPLATASTGSDGEGEAGDQGGDQNGDVEGGGGETDGSADLQPESSTDETENEPTSELTENPQPSPSSPQNLVPSAENCNNGQDDDGDGDADLADSDCTQTPPTAPLTSQPNVLPGQGFAMPPNGMLTRDDNLAGKFGLPGIPTPTPLPLTTPPTQSPTLAPDVLPGQGSTPVPTPSPTGTQGLFGSTIPSPNLRQGVVGPGGIIDPGGSDPFGAQKGLCGTLDIICPFGSTIEGEGLGGAGAPPTPGGPGEAHESACGDGADNDGDGAADTQDPDCVGSKLPALPGEAGSPVGRILTPGPAGRAGNPGLPTTPTPTSLPVLPGSTTGEGGGFIQMIPTTTPPTTTPPTTTPPTTTPPTTTPPTTTPPTTTPPTTTPPTTTPPTIPPTPIIITNINNNQVTVRNDGGFTVQNTAGAVTSTPDCPPQSATVLLGPSAMENGGARILAAFDPCILNDGTVVLNLPDEKGIQLVAANIVAGQTTQSAIVPVQRIAPITEGQTLYSADLSGQITGPDPATGNPVTLNGNINALFLLNAGGQNVELSADNSAALNAVLS